MSHLYDDLLPPDEDEHERLEAEARAITEEIQKVQALALAQKQARKRKRNPNPVIPVSTEPAQPLLDEIGNPVTGFWLNRDGIPLIGVDLQPLLVPLDVNRRPLSSAGTVKQAKDVDKKPLFSSDGQPLMHLVPRYVKGSKRPPKKERVKKVKIPKPIVVKEPKPKRVKVKAEPVVVVVKVPKPIQQPIVAEPLGANPWELPEVVDWSRPYLVTSSTEQQPVGYAARKGIINPKLHETRVVYTRHDLLPAQPPFMPDPLLPFFAEFKQCDCKTCLTFDEVRHRKKQRKKLVSDLPPSLDTTLLNTTVAPHLLYCSSCDYISSRLTRIAAAESANPDTKQRQFVCEQCHKLVTVTQEDIVDENNNKKDNEDENNKINETKDRHDHHETQTAIQKPTATLVQQETLTTTTSTITQASEISGI